jgi:hypothetical protein
MFLAEAESLEALDDRRDALQEAIDRWQRFPASVISDHRDRCCRNAQEWFLAMDHSQMGAADERTGPRWIRQRHAWGPTRWPIHWCEALASKTLDCGALAALALVAFQARGVRCHTAQLIQRYTKGDGQHWCRNWEANDAEVCWIQDDLVYHEACAVVARGDEIRIWDPTASWWVNPKQFEGYGAVVALRILTSDALQTRELRWGRHRIRPNEWQRLDTARGDFA